MSAGENGEGQAAEAEAAEHGADAEIAEPVLLGEQNADERHHAEDGTLDRHGDQHHARPVQAEDARVLAQRVDEKTTAWRRRGGEPRHIAPQAAGHACEAQRQEREDVAPVHVVGEHARDREAGDRAQMARSGRERRLLLAVGRVSRQASTSARAARGEAGGSGGDDWPRLYEAQQRKGRERAADAGSPEGAEPLPTGPKRSRMLWATAGGSPVPSLGVLASKRDFRTQRIAGRRSAIEKKPRAEQEDRLPGGGLSVASPAAVMWPARF